MKATTTECYTIDFYPIEAVSYIFRDISGWYGVVLDTAEGEDYLGNFESYMSAADAAEKEVREYDSQYEGEW